MTTSEDNDLLLDKNKIIQYRKWFSNYSASFQNLSPKQMKNIELKIEHTHKVCKIILDIGNSLSLNEQQLYLAEAVALFHDIGRFEQISRYNTFSDAHSMDHGDFGAEVLKEFKIIDNLNSYTQNIIFKCLIFHNKLELPSIDEEELLLFLKLIRDADKIDIFRVLLKYHAEKDEKKKDQTVVLNLNSEDPISKKVTKKILNDKMVEKKDLRNVNDFKVLNLAWIYDLNYRRTFELFLENEYIKKMCDLLPESKEKELIIEKINSYLEDILS